MTKTQAIEIIRSGQFFSCEFKKQDGTNRKLNGRYGVKKHLKGGTKGYNADDMGLITVWDRQAKGYRSIPVVNMHKCNGKKIQ